VVPPAPALLAQPEPEPELPAAAELPAHLPAEPEPELPAASAAQPAAVDDVPASVAARGTAEPTDAAVEAAQDAPVADAGAAGREPEAELKADAEPKAGSAPEADGAPGPQPPASPPPPIEIPAGAVIGASVDVGATSVHLLVAAVGGHRVEPLLDESVFLGLGDRVSADGRLGPVARDELVAALVGYAGAARHLGASRITMVGTEPMRRAHDTAAVAAAVEARAGVPLHVLDHAEEGLLMLLGVTKGRPITSNLLVVDIGGGSSELVVVDRDGHEYAVGLALGANRLTRDLVRGDPPTMAELEAMRARARQVLAGAPDVQPGEIVAVGGTASNLLRLLPATALDRVLTRRRLTVALAMLTVERSMEAAERHLVRPARARILPAGAIIVDAILERYGADRMRVSDEGIREGLVLAAAVAGPAWRDRLPELVRGWTDEVLQTE
jgi:exopolyphosphatase/guanosine-5'-triphosphate,3'-diphosphate pyrophosphatase